MKNALLVVALGLCFSTSSFAQYSQNLQKQKTKLPKPTAAQPMTSTVGWGFVGGYSTANQLQMNDTAGETSFDSKANSNGAFFLGARYTNIVSHEFTFMPVVSYEFARTLKGDVFLQDSNTGADPTASFIVLEPNMVYAFTPHIYTLGGINFPLVLASTGNLSGALGFQAGAGYQLNSQFGVEALYRTLNLNPTPEGVTINRARLWGFILRASFTIPETI